MIFFFFFENTKEVCPICLVMMLNKSRHAKNIMQNIYFPFTGKSVAYTSKGSSNDTANNSSVRQTILSTTGGMKYTIITLFLIFLI